MTIKEWQQEVHQGARDRGWYDGELGERSPVRITSMLALIHSEASEAVEDVRAGQMETTLCPTRLYPASAYLDWESSPPPQPLRPEGFPSELADIMIRCMDLAEWLGIDLEEQIRIKNEYNRTRGTRHGGKTL